MAVLFSPKPVVISFCGSDLLGNYNPSGRKTWMGYLSILLSQLAALGAHRCIAKTEELRQALWLASDRHKCEVIPNGIDFAQFRPLPQPEARATLGWLHNDPVALFMDRQGAWVKDPELARAAFQEARKIVPALRMCIVETEPPDKMPLFYNAADVLLLTSRHEGSNNTVKEALACNLPVVATACGDIPQRLYRVSHSYVCSRDPAALGVRLAEVVTARERSNGRQSILDLTLDRVALRIKQCYEKTLELSPFPQWRGNGGK
jgi:glycosyltransferase involved in cell wall biosynthesis